jgi:hypothetical protein
MVPDWGFLVGAVIPDWIRDLSFFLLWAAAAVRKGDPGSSPG